MTIVMIGQKGLPARSGGIERHVESLAHGLRLRGHQVVVFARPWYVKNAAAPEGIIQETAPSIPTKHLDAITHGLSALLKTRKYQPDVIHLHGVGTALLAPLARLLFSKARVVTTLHCLDRKQSKWGAFARLAFRLGEWSASVFSHRAIAVSQELVCYFLRSYGCQTTYIPHAYRVPARPDRVQLESGFQESIKPEKYFLFVGRLLPHKGAHVLLEAYLKFEERHPELSKHAPLVVVGAGSWTDNYVERLRSMVSRSKSVYLLGERLGDELRWLQHRAMAHVFPTFEEGLSYAVVEAGSTGRPLIMTDIQANHEVVSEGALIIPTNDSESLYKAMLTIATEPEEKRQARGRQIRAEVAKRFDFDEGIDQVLRLYQEICTGDERLITPVPLVF